MNESEPGVQGRFTGTGRRELYAPTGRVYGRCFVDALGNGRRKKRTKKNRKKKKEIERERERERERVSTNKRKQRSTRRDMKRF